MKTKVKLKTFQSIAKEKEIKPKTDCTQREKKNPLNSGL